MMIKATASDSRPTGTDAPSGVDVDVSVTDRTKLRPGKRLRNWYRRDREAVVRMSLRVYARWTAAQPLNDETAVARAWLASKAVR